MVNRLIRQPFIWLAAGSLTWQVLLIWQGLDFTDLGYSLTGHQQFYIAPEGIGEGLVNWLSYFIGHWLGAFFGGAVISYKLAYVLVITITALSAYAGLASIFGHSRFLATIIFLVTLFIGKASENWIGYNNLTALFYTVGAILLFHGLIKESRALIMLAGMVLGANIFVRFPNILGVLLVSAVWLHAWSKHWSIWITLRGTAYFLSGAMLGITLIWMLISWHDHQQFYFEGIYAILGMATDPNSHHSGSGLLKMFVQDHLKAFMLASIFAITGAVASQWIATRKNALRKGLILICATLLAAIFYYEDLWKWILVGFFYLSLIAIIAMERHNRQPLALMAFIAFMVLMLTPLGSNTGMRNAMYGLWLALPLVMTWLLKQPNRTPDVPLSLDPARQTFVNTILLAIGINAIVTSWLYTYRDSEDRLAMTHSIAAPLLIGCLTTEARAHVVGELLRALPKYVRPGDSLLAYNEMPLIHFLTKTRPWLGNPWPMLYGPSKIDRLLRLKEINATTLPVIVRAKINTSSRQWPENSSTMGTEDREDESRRIFAKFEQRHDYEVVWSNGSFEILITGEQ